MAPKIKHKRSALANNPPTAGQIEAGELAINTNSTSANLHFEDDGGTVRSVGADPSAAGTYERNVATADGVGTWVVAGSQAPGNDAPYGHWDRDNASTTLSPRIAGDDLEIGSGNITLNADGSAEFAGNVTLPGGGGNTQALQKQEIVSLIPSAANDGQININAGTGITASGNNATANQSGNTTRTLSLNTSYTDGRYVKKSGDIMSGNLTVPSLNGGQLAGFRNLLINGNALIAQRTTASGAVAGNSRIYGLFDRWVIGVTAGGSWGTAYTYRDNRNAMLFNAASVANFTVGQVIEYTNAWHLSGKTATLSGWVKAASAFTATTGLAWQDTATDATIPGAGADVTDTLPITTSWTYFSQTFTVPTTPPIAGYSSTWGLTAGFSNLPPNASFEIQDIQFEEGSVATPFECRPIGTELALCQRFYQRKVVDMRVYAVAGGIYAFPQHLPVSMRAIPTTAFVQNTVNLNTASASLAPVGVDTLRFSITAGTVGDTYRQDLYALSAEL